MSETSNALEQIPCIFGHGFNEEVAIEENGYKGRRCKTCCLIYISPRPVRGEVIDLYAQGEAYSPVDYVIGPNPTASLAAKHHVAHLKKVMPPLGPTGKPRSILEIGCGGGHFLSEAKKAGYEVFGLELNPQQASHIEKKLGVPCETKPLSPSTFGNRKFDIIFHVDVTSHFADPFTDFQIMHEKLTANGCLCFETGNGADIDPKYYHYFAVFQYPDHLFFFGQKTIRELLSRVGFTDIQIKSWSILPQLSLIKLIRHRLPEKSTNQVAKAAPKTSKGKAFLKVALAYCNHFVRYKLGAFVSTAKTPATLLITAWKRDCKS
jgi:SAM-dependent methyltransferase